MTSQVLHSRILKTDLVAWRELMPLQQESFKDLSAEAATKLRTSILENQFAQPFYVWYDESDDVHYCLDGFHRIILLAGMKTEGITVPEQLPAVFIQCVDKREAAKLVLIYSSVYAKVTQQGMYDFVQAFDLEYGELMKEVDLPSFSSDRFEQKFDFYRTGEAEAEERQSNGNIFVQPGDLFELDGHRVICGSFTDAATVDLLMNGKKARILNCDPPYNLPADFFLNDNKRHNNHKDFAMGAGEMSDEEFVDFLALIMQRAVDHSLPGAIHYIFMDFRHVWHMTEAGRKVYGSPQPKQLCVWNKDMMANGSFYRAKHELCFVFDTEQAKALWNKDLADHGGNYKDNNELVFIFKAGDDKAKHLSHLDLKDRIRSNVWNYPSATSTANPDRYELKNHPTPKPVQMIADAILDTTNPGDVVIDWFLGSGTCLIACAQTGRFCYAMEIEPRYVQNDIIRYLLHAERKGVEANFKHLNGSLNRQDFINVYSGGKT